MMIKRWEVFGIPDEHTQKWRKAEDFEVGLGKEDEDDDNGEMMRAKRRRKKESKNEQTMK